VDFAQDSADQCKGCGLCVSLDENALPAIHHSNKAYVRDAEFKCRKCGPIEVRGYIPISQDEADMFLTGDPCQNRAPGFPFGLAIRL
jgi:hypothetical protein